MAPTLKLVIVDAAIIKSSFLPKHVIAATAAIIALSLIEHGLTRELELQDLSGVVVLAYALTDVMGFEDKLRNYDELVCNEMSDSIINAVESILSNLEESFYKRFEEFQGVLNGKLAELELFFDSVQPRLLRRGELKKIVNSVCSQLIKCVEHRGIKIDEYTSKCLEQAKAHLRSNILKLIEGSKEVRKVLCEDIFNWLVPSIRRVCMELKHGCGKVDELLILTGDFKLCEHLNTLLGGIEANDCISQISVVQCLRDRCEHSIKDLAVEVFKQLYNF